MLEDISNKPPAKKIMGTYIIDGELTLLVGKTCSGKSVLSWQIAEGFSKGEPILGMLNEHPTAPVMLFDFENKDGTLGGRYCYDGEYIKGMRENHNFYYIRDNSLSDNPDTLFSAIRYYIEKYGLKMVIIDNIGYLTTKASTEQSEALILMKKLNAVCSQYHVSLICIAHTPKIKETRPMSIYDIEGSAKICNYADNVFFVCNSKDSGRKYLKQAKFRSSSEKGLVDVLEFSDDTHLHFVYAGPGNETDLLPKDEGDTAKDTANVDIIRDVIGAGCRHTDFVNRYTERTGKSSFTAKAKLKEYSDRGIIYRDADKKMYYFNAEFAKTALPDDDEEPF